MKPTLLYVASRWPWPVTSGRQRMIAQTLEMAARSHDVTLLAVSSDPAPPIPDFIKRTFAFQRPGLFAIGKDCLKYPFAPLQSHLFAAGPVDWGVLIAVSYFQPTVVMLDMIRLAGLASRIREAAPKTRIIIDLDDRLADRYRQMRRCGESNLLGAFADRMPKALRSFASIAPTALLWLEEWLVRKAERAAALAADGIALVSPVEAKGFGAEFQRPGLMVSPVPPVIETRQAAPRNFTNGVRFVFLGNAAYAPNAEALRLLDEMVGRLTKKLNGKQAFRFEAGGAGTDKLELQHVRGLGFVDDLDAFLGPDTIMVAPIVTGTGVKTKLLDAMARGVPIMTTEKGVEGIDLRNGQTGIVRRLWQDLEDDMETVILARAGHKCSATQDQIDMNHLSDMGLAAAEVARRDHGHDKIAAELGRLLAGGIAIQKETA